MIFSFESNHAISQVRRVSTQQQHANSVLYRPKLYWYSSSTLKNVSRDS